MIVRHAHGKADALARDVHLHHLDLDHVARLDHLARVLDELVGQRGDMHQAVLVHADVDKGAEVGDVGDHPFEDHPRLQVLELLDALLELGGLEFRARVAAGLVQLLDDILHGRFTELLVGKIVGGKGVEEFAVADK